MHTLSPGVCAIIERYSLTDTFSDVDMQPFVSNFFSEGTEGSIIAMAALVELNLALARRGRKRTATEAGLEVFLDVDAKHKLLHFMAMQNLATQNQALTARNEELLGFLREAEERVDRLDWSLVLYEARVNLYNFKLRQTMDIVRYLMNTWADENLVRRANLLEALGMLTTLTNEVLDLPAEIDDGGSTDEVNDEENDDH